MKRVIFRTAEVAALVDVSKKTILNWLKRGHIPEPLRNGTNNYREWTEHDVGNLLEFANRYRKYESLRGSRKRLTGKESLV